MWEALGDTLRALALGVGFIGVLWVISLITNWVERKFGQ